MPKTVCVLLKGAAVVTKQFWVLFCVKKMLYCILQSWNAIWLNTGEITADLCHVVVLFSSIKADDEHISLKVFFAYETFL